LSGDALATLLQAYDYQVTRQTGSHLRLTTRTRGTHSVTIPRHRAIRIGTLSAILAEVAAHLEKTRGELADELFS
jgi:predicted RNA binding protein YcfA (HicA-like mRNA interferase family)